MLSGAPTLKKLLEALKKLENWFLFGAMLGVPVSELKKIEFNHPKDSDRCKLEMLQYWLDTEVVPTWNEVVRTLEKIDQLALAAGVKDEYSMPSGDKGNLWYSLLRLIYIFSKWRLIQKQLKSILHPFSLNNITN